jgi:APA family basic amino acid/polyamine antiporter
VQRAETAMKRSLGSPALFAIVWTGLAASLYFSLGVVAEHALGLTPVVFLVAGLFFVLCVMTYVEGASLHQERAGSTVFARHAFNELWSFVAGWAILLDYLILIALCTFAATNYAATFWAPLGREGTLEVLVVIALVVYVAVANVMGLRARRLRTIAALAVFDLALQLIVIVAGLALVFNASALVDPIDLGTSPTWSEVGFALTVAAAAFTALEASSGLAGEVAVGRRGLKRLVAVRTATVMVVYVGIAVVALTAVPVDGGRTALGGRFEEAPLLGVVGAFDPGGWFSDGLKYGVGITATVVLIAAANGAMLGLSRLGYALATNRQVPSALGRLHPTRGTPFVLIAVAAALAAGLVIPLDLEFLIGIYAFGAMLAFTIAHVAVCVLRYREPDRDRPYRMPGSIRVGGGALPLPAALGAALSAAGWVAVIAFHDGSRIVGPLWMAFGIVLYVVYRATQEKSLFRRVTVPEAALREDRTGTEYGSILVPLLGTPLDDDIVQTAGRLAGEGVDKEEAGGAVIEALWIFEIPMSLPLDAALPEQQLHEAREKLARAKRVGEEYEGVEVATATVRARRAGQAIVDQARRRGVEAIVLAAEEASRVRGGLLLGGRGGPLDDYVGDVTRYVVGKAPCRVILTAPPAEAAAGDGTGGAGGRPDGGPEAAAHRDGREGPGSGEAGATARPDRASDDPR